MCSIFERGERRHLLLFYRCRDDTAVMVDVVVSKAQASRSSNMVKHQCQGVRRMASKLTGRESTSLPTESTKDVMGN